MSDYVVAPLRLSCECGEWIETNDVYLYGDVQKLWDEWHEEGSFVAGKYHKPISSAAKLKNTQTAAGHE